MHKPKLHLKYITSNNKSTKTKHLLGLVDGMFGPETELPCDAKLAGEDGVPGCCINV